MGWSFWVDSVRVDMGRMVQTYFGWMFRKEIERQNSHPSRG